MIPKLRIFDKETNQEVTSQDMYFIGTDNMVYKLDDGDCLTIDRTVYWELLYAQVR
jgi:hypothetical protein